MALFTRSHQKAKNPIVDLSLLKNLDFLTANKLIMTIEICFFFIYQTFPILIRILQSVGFGGGPVENTAVQLPFVIFSFVISVISGLLIAKVENLANSISYGLSSIRFVLLY